MDLPDTLLSSIKINSLQSRANDILNNLQNAGLFRALVVESNGNKVLLDTAFGKISGQVADKLVKGDEVLARLTPGKTDPAIKIEQVQTSRQALPEKLTAQLIKMSASSTPPHSLPVAIKVLSHADNKTLLTMGHKTYSIPRQALLKAGETLLLKSSANQKVELLKVQPDAILKNALSSLLPRLTGSKHSVDLFSLQHSLSRLLKLSTTSAQTVNPIGAGGRNTLESTQKETPIKTLKQQLTTLSQPLARVDNFKPDSLLQIFRLLSLVKNSPSSNTSHSTSSLTHQMGDLYQSIKNSPENFRSVIRQIIDTNTGGIAKPPSENALLDLSSTIKAEILQQLEQTLSQQLMQKTTVRLNQELNQPVQINLNIPLQMNNETTSLRLKIKQRNNSESDDEQHWEINLAFEFGLLGLISTNILLQDTRLSASFWAVKASTKQLIDTHMGQFKNQLKKSGFELGFFDCFIGKPVTNDETEIPVDENLVDIKV